MSSEYKIGAVADFIARLSQEKHSTDSVISKQEFPPTTKTKAKKRKLCDTTNTNEKKITFNDTKKSGSKKNKVDKNKEKKEQDYTSKESLPVKLTRKNKLNKKKARNIVAELKESTSKNKKQLKKKVKTKQNKENSVTVSPESKNVETKESPINSKDSEYKKASEPVEKIAEGAEKTHGDQKVAKGFPKYLGNSISEEEKDKPKLNEEEESRTIFVGNLPLRIPRDRVTNMFKPYGEVQTVRFRSVPVADIKLPRKACVKMNKIHEKRTNMNAYVRFKNIESVEKALEMNGHVINEHTIRVDRALEKTTSNAHAIFIGNLPFEAEEEEIRKAFEDCGEIDNVRVIRDQQTNIGKGFGYVNFKSADGVAFALELENVKIRKREIRIKRSFDKKHLGNAAERFSSSHFKSKSFSGGNSDGFKGGKRLSNTNRGVERRLANGRRRDFGSKMPPRGFNKKNDSVGFKDRNTGAGFKGRNDQGGYNKREAMADRTKNFSRKNNFRGSTAEEKSNRNNQKKKKLSYDALKKFIIAKKLSGGGEKKKGFNFLSSS